MPQPRAKITNLHALANRHEQGEPIAALARETLPEAVDYRTLAAAFKRINCRPKGIK